MGADVFSFEDRSRRWDIDCLSRLCLGRRFCCRCCRNVDEDGSLPTFDLVTSKRSTLCPTQLQTSCDSSICDSSDPFPEQTSKPCSSKLSTSCSPPTPNLVNENCCGSAHVLELVHDTSLSTCHLNAHIFFDQSFSCSSI